MIDRSGLGRASWECLMRMFMSDEVHDRFHRACAAADVPHPGALKTLLQLSAENPPSMRALAGILHCDASYVTAMVDLLESAGHVERRVSPKDRRVKLVHLTAGGEGALKTALDVMLTPPAGFEELTDAELRAMHKLLAKAASAYAPVGVDVL